MRLRYCLAIAALCVGCGRPATAVERPAAPAAGRAGTVHLLADGATVRETEIDRQGTPMTVWIYRPAKPATGRLPVILIAAAGTPLVWGIKLADDDRAEHLPWVAHGYLVVAYSLDGPVEDNEDSAAVAAGIQAFVRAAAGLDNAKAALDYALASEPRADPERLYAVGHSSAATLALRVGAELARIKAVVAFNPITDVDAHIAPFLDSIRLIDPQAQACLHASSPSTHVAALRAKPVFLFHSSEDTTVPVEESQRLADALKPLPGHSRVLIVPTGDHYHSMLEQGVPAALAWLDARTAAPPP